MVAVNADASVKRRGKGDERPVDGLEDCTVLARIYEAFPLPDLPCLDAILFRYITFEELDRIVDSVDRLVFGD